MPRDVTETCVMSKLLSALLLSFSLAAVACDEPDDDKGAKRNDTGDDTTDTTDTSDEGDTTDGDVGVDVPGTSGGGKTPGCISASLPATGGPAGTIGDDC
jgi:hypothetical protein